MEREKKQRDAMLRWAKNNGFIVCKTDAIHRLVQIVNEVALGINATVDEDGDVHFNHVSGLDYQEMVGLKLIIHAGPEFRVRKSGSDEDEAEEDDVN